MVLAGHRLLHETGVALFPKKGNSQRKMCGTSPRAPLHAENSRGFLRPAQPGNKTYGVSTAADWILIVLKRCQV